MTQPRMCLPGTTYLVTRSVDSRRFLLKPDPVVNSVVLYCMFRATAPLGIQVHAISTESNHLHLVVTDPAGDISRFMHSMDRLIACCLLSYYRETHPHEHREGFWVRGQFNAMLAVMPDYFTRGSSWCGRPPHLAIQEGSPCEPAPRYVQCPERAAPTAPGALPYPLKGPCRPTT